MVGGFICFYRMAFRQRPKEKPGEMTGRWMTKTQRVNEAQGGKDGWRRRRRINPGREEMGGGRGERAL